jgi:hypothetical protein
VRLTRTSLPVRHDSTVVSVSDAVQHGFSNPFENLLLRALKIEDVVEHEGDFLSSSVLVNDELCVIADAMQTFRIRILLFFLVVKGTKAAEDFDIASLFLLVH